ncbi:hypothetical protein PR001_g5984 [Phytophthora rubi]|uniref:MULE transposase domain-containing protein n=1 Tax=Phytophthora rubi TaxID=129364 RepID=A0A6A3NI51_9STRA|nr:hypothetical protein PR001_g5984 [Phytophthora rubi]
MTKRRAFYTDATMATVWQRGLDCDRKGSPEHLPENTRVRPMRGSKKMGCKMKLVVQTVSKDEPHRPWKIVHTRNGSQVHNHTASEDARVHACHRRRAAAAENGGGTTQSVQALVEAQTAAGVSVASIRATLIQANHDSFVIPKDIANTRSAVRSHELSTNTAMEALFADLSKRGFLYRYETNQETQELRYLFWAHPSTAALYRRHYDVLVVDCTYKTNKFKVPLFNIISVTGFNTVLPVAQCWLPGETEGDYVWALNMMRLFWIEKNVDLPGVVLSDREQACMNAVDWVLPEIPTMVCRWHMNTNVEAMARKHLGQVTVVDPVTGVNTKENTWEADAFLAAFHEAVDSKTESEFETRRAALKEHSEYLASYLDINWWKYKERIVRVWTDRYPHFGVRDTSLVEGTHAKCKGWIRSSRGDMYTVFKSLLPWWEGAAADNRLISARNAVITPALLQPSHFAAVVRVITVYALTETQKLWKDAYKVVYSRL